jgi:hypothetical protein
MGMMADEKTAHPFLFECSHSNGWMKQNDAFAKTDSGQFAKTGSGQAVVSLLTTCGCVR